MVACDAVKDSSAILNTFMKGGGACKDVVHTWNALGVVGGGETCVSHIFARSMLEESVFYT